MFVLPLSRTVQSPAHRAIAPQLTRALDRLFDDSFDRYLGGSANAGRTPALDVTESDAGYTLAFDMPGVSREQLKVSVEGRRVTVESVAAAPTEPAPKAGTSQMPADEAAKVEAGGASPDVARPASAPTLVAAPRVLYRERSAARYARTVSLPAEVDQGASQARFENGVLTLTLAKKVPTGATRLAIA